MGGCRCFFRECRVNSYKQTQIHFFRVPLKDAERSKKWIAYGKLEYMLNFPPAKQKNVVICSRHFRDECFMNYKKDRLTPTAVPSIFRLSRTKALDYEMDLENGVLVTLPEVQLKHLVPPEGFECPLGLENDQILLSKLNDLENPQECGAVKVLNGVMFVREAVENIAPSTSVGSSSRSLIKRPQNTQWIEDGMEMSCSTSKKQKIDQVALPQGTIIELETPTIINHQIIEVDGNLWIEPESYSIANKDGEFELIEATTDDEETFKDLEEIENKSSNETRNVILDGNECNLEQWEDNCKDTEQEVNNITTVIINTPGNSDIISLDKTPASNNDDVLNKLLLELNLIKKENASLKRDVESSQIQSKESERKLREMYEQHMETERTKYEAKESSLLKDLEALRNENKTWKKKLESTQMLSKISAKKLKDQYEQQMETERMKYASKEDEHLEQIKALQQELNNKKEELTKSINTFESLRNELSTLQTRNSQLIEQQLQSDLTLQQHSDLDIKYKMLLNNHEELQKSHAKLKEDFKKLENQLQNQVATITTTDPVPVAVTKPPAAVSTNSLTKAQLFNGIKRYISSSMVALLRMEMFGNSDREWKTDEKQAAVDLLRLGENVYKYFTDEWRFRLPGLRDVRDWLSQSVQMDEEEDL
ncbi:centromere-associated protein E [Musca domestica]|uniref:Centromere-associated protein E n=1 Tax=Musca domestica TaxID=7370 RepID=A0A1I8N174_MUSDO|nr:centromere-associated protein E [Musca domestica]